jgi:hypothetical protein
MGKNNSSLLTLIAAALADYIKKTGSNATVNLNLGGTLDLTGINEEFLNNIELPAFKSQLQMGTLKLHQIQVSVNGGTYFEFDPIYPQKMFNYNQNKGIVAAFASGFDAEPFKVFAPPTVGGTTLSVPAYVDHITELDASVPSTYGLEKIFKLNIRMTGAETD